MWEIWERDGMERYIAGGFSPQLLLHEWRWTRWVFIWVDGKVADWWNFTSFVATCGGRGWCRRHALPPAPGSTWWAGDIDDTRWSWENYSSAGKPSFQLIQSPSLMKIPLNSYKGQISTRANTAQIWKNSERLLCSGKHTFRSKLTITVCQYEVFFRFIWRVESKVQTQCCRKALLFKFTA